MAESKMSDGIPSEGPLKTLGQVGSTQAVLEQSAPWLGVEPERNFVAEPPWCPASDYWLHRFLWRRLSTHCSLRTFETLRHLNLLTAKSVAGNVLVSALSSGPWARSLLEAVSPPGVQVSDDATTPVQDTLESSEGIENGGDEISSESSLKSGSLRQKSVALAFGRR